MWHCPKTVDLLHFHHLLRKRKYRRLFSSQRGRRPGAKGPAQALIDAVLELKRRNPTWGCPRIAPQITWAFGVDIDKDVVRRILGKHYRPESGSGGPSWLTFLGQAKDRLWSADLLRGESLRLRTHWVLMGRRWAGCSSERFQGQGCPSISAERGCQHRAEPRSAAGDRPQSVHQPAEDSLLGIMLLNCPRHSRSSE
jgi:hypothetical protein